MYNIHHAYFNIAERSWKASEAVTFDGVRCCGWFDHYAVNWVVNAQPMPREELY